MDPYADDPSPAPARPAEGSPAWTDPLDGPDTGALPAVPAAAPSVVAVVVTHDPGDWFEETLASFTAQDYPSLSVLVIDAASAQDPTARIAAALPEAFVRRLETNPGFGPAANEVLEVVDGAAFYLLCHDDVALAPGAVRTMVEESYRSNAGVIGPKLVDWDDPRRLLQVGLLADKTGYPAPLVEPGELDQEQHDAVRDVFAVPGGATLVRADLFEALEGYDAAVPLLGDDLDLCWRAQVAGARVVVAPAAVVRHVEALGDRGIVPVTDRRRYQMRHRLRTLLTCYGRSHRFRVVPQAALLALVEVVYAVLAGHRRQAADIVGAYRWNHAHRKELPAARARLEKIRTVPDKEVRRLQVRGSARFSAFLRGQIGRNDERLRALTRSAGNVADSFTFAALRTSLAGAALIAVVVLLGSRDFLTGPSPALVDLPQLPTRPWPVLAEWTSGWRYSGLGQEAAAPTAYGLLGLAGTVLFTSMGLLTRLLVLVPLLLGPLGAARLLRPSRSPRGALVAAVAYAAIPVPYNALAEGRWGGLIVWSATPWVVVAVARAQGVEPFERARRPVWRAALGLGLIVALAGAVVPLAVAVPLLVALALVVGGLLTATIAGSLRALATAVGAAVVAVALHLPWSLELLDPGGTWAAVGGVRSGAAPPSFAELLRFELGPIGAGPLGFAFLVAGVLPLLFGQGWRLRWAVRAWTLVVVSVAASWASGLDAFPVALGPPEVLLAPAACGLALAAALGVIAFEVDLPAFRFGWRQVASVVAAAALVVGAVPTLAAVRDGAWGAPPRGLTSVLSFLDREQEEVGAFRTMWIGDPAVLPLAGERYADGVAWAVTDEGRPTLSDRFTVSPDGASSLLAEAVRLAERGETSRLGELVAPMGVRYVVVTETDRPIAPAEDAVPVPVALADALGQQLDLARVDVDAGAVVYRNEVWAPTRAVLPDDVDAAGGGGAYFLDAAAADLSDAEAALLDVDGTGRFAGGLEAGDRLLWSVPRSSRWVLEVDGEEVPSSPAFAFAGLYDVPAGGDATLRYETSIQRDLVLAGQAVLWVVALAVVRAARRRESQVLDLDLVAAAAAADRAASRAVAAEVAEAAAEAPEPLPAPERADGGVAPATVGAPAERDGPGGRAVGDPAGPGGTQ